MPKFHEGKIALVQTHREFLSRAQVPASVRDAIRLGRLTALQNQSAGDVVRRLVAGQSQQLMEDVERATAPFQCALSTTAGCECIAHMLQGSPIWTLEPQ